MFINSSLLKARWPVKLSTQSWNCLELCAARNSKREDLLCLTAIILHPKSQNWPDSCQSIELNVEWSAAVSFQTNNWAPIHNGFVYHTWIFDSMSLDLTCVFLAPVSGSKLLIKRNGK